MAITSSYLPIGNNYGILPNLHEFQDQVWNLELGA